MGLQLLAAAAALPEITEVGRARGEPVRRPAAPPERMALDAALSVCQSALERAGCSASEVGLILSKGVSPSHVALTADIVGPRLAHPLQHALRAPQAFVFDLLDAPWVAALETAEVFLQDLGRSVALLVQSENSASSVDPDPSSGFSISDGVGALVLRLTPTFSRASFVPVGGNRAPAKVLVNPAGSARRTRMVFDADAELALEVRVAMLKALELQLEQLDRRDSPLVVAEQWFTGHEPDIGLSMLRGAEPADVSLGAMSIPTALARHCGRERLQRNVLLLGFDPFRLQVSCRSILASIS
jgi:3-oxoacyl-[acyl-carrier-protein] synthase III